MMYIHKYNINMLLLSLFIIFRYHLYHLYHRQSLPEISWCFFQKVPPPGTATCTVTEELQHLGPARRLATWGSTSSRNGKCSEETVKKCV